VSLRQRQRSCSESQVQAEEIKMPVTFQLLPNEILLAIIVRVPFSFENFGALTLTSRHVYEVMKTDSPRILENIASTQFPDALHAIQFPQTPFSGGYKVFSIAQLGDLKGFTEWVEEDIKQIESVRQAMIAGRSLGPYIGTKGWKQNLRHGLHLLGYPSIERNLLRRGFGGCRQRSSEHELFLKSVPEASLLALKHGVFMIFEALRFSDSEFKGRQMDLERPAGADNVFEDDTLLSLIMRNATEYVTSCGWLVYWLGIEDGAKREEGRARIYERLQVDIRGALWASTRLEVPLARSIHHCASRRLQDIIENWDEFAAENPTMIDDLQQEGGSSDDGTVRTMVESFLNPSAAAS
jgi:hypothetical protein